MPSPLPRSKGSPSPLSARRVTCPGDRPGGAPPGAGLTSYGCNMGDWYLGGRPGAPASQGAFAPDVCRGLAGFPGDTSQTILAAEVTAGTTTRLRPGPFTVNDPSRVPGPVFPFGSRLFGDPGTAPRYAAR
jgi:hypothetical protein